MTAPSQHNNVAQWEQGERKEDSASSEIVNSGTGRQPNGAALPSYTGAGATGRTGRGSASLGPGDSPSITCTVRDATIAGLESIKGGGRS